MYIIVVGGWCGGLHAPLLQEYFIHTTCIRHLLQELENVTMLQMSLTEANRTCLVSRRYVHVCACMYV